MKMKKILFTFVLLILVSSTTFADGIDANTKLLLHFDGENGSTNFVDSSSSQHPVTAIGDAQIDTAETLFGTGAGLFTEPSNWNVNGTGDYLSIPQSEDWNFGSQDFTIDLWARFNSFNPYAQAFASTATADGDYSNGAWAFYWGFGNLYFTDFTGVPHDVFVPVQLNAEQWYHFALVRNNTDLMFFVNGVQQGNSFFLNTAIQDVNTDLKIGRYRPNNNSFIDGRMDELRITKGLARWTGDFIPETSPYSNAVPEPATIFLLGSGMLGAVVRRRK